jgi:hypothetical protein
MTFRVLLMLICGMSCTPVLAQTTDVPAQLWDRPRTGALVLGQESVKRVVVAALAEPDARIVIHHPAGQEPQIQAEELRSWLGALAIDPRRVVLRGDLGAGTAMKMELVR